MKKVLACAVTMAILSMASFPAKGEETGAYAEGKTLYQEKCQMCHGEKGEGNGPMASAFVDPPANFTEPEFWKDNPDRRIRNVVENGFKLMPPIDLSPDQIRKVIDYMSHTFKR